MREYHVAKTGSNSYIGTEEYPFLTISKAAEMAEAGDCIVVHEGVYREWVKPRNGGRNNVERIVYKAAKGEKVVIKGSEHIDGWEPLEGDVWKVILLNTFFGDYNPYKEVLGGDWFIVPNDNSLHTGEVYMNGKSFYEAKNMEEVKNPTLRTHGTNPPWTSGPEPLLHPEDSLYQWYTESDDLTTTIYANFQGKNPNEEYVEISVRRSCFYPEKIGRNYITVQGFEIAQAACQWAPPTSDQTGMLGCNWSKGWIIEDNILHDAKCSGISIGKEASTGENISTRTHRKSGYQYQMEAVFLAKRNGWEKETVGSHIIRNNRIYDCGQSGIVGHMGCAFSKIYDNCIYNIGVKHEFFGHEIAGIKLHAAIDVQIIHNHIHHCTLGTWLDWQAQGARISRNLYRSNNRDLMVEVTHGPYIVDNNIFASAYNFDNIAQGGAYIHNLCWGSIRRAEVLDRSTPYHYAHTTDIAGTAFVYSGDDRIYQNIFFGREDDLVENSCYGTEGYTGFLTSLEEYKETVTALGNGDHEQFVLVRQPVYIDGNVYLQGARPFPPEQNYYIGEGDLDICLRDDGQTVYLEFEVEKELLQVSTKIYSTSDLGAPRITEATYENPDGTSICFDIDYLGGKRGDHPVAGPLEGIKQGKNCIRVW